MSGLPLPEDGAPPPIINTPKFTVSHQDVELDIDFSSRTIYGKTAITIDPSDKDLRAVSLRCRQLKVKSVKVDKWPVHNFQYKDAHEALKFREGFTPRQHHWIQENYDHSTMGNDLIIPLPSKMRVTPATTTLRVNNASFTPSADLSSATTPASGSDFRAFVVYIEYEAHDMRDGLHWVGLNDQDPRYPHVYTYSNSLAWTTASYMFPCVDEGNSKHPWRLSITCPRTLGDINSPSLRGSNIPHTNGLTNGVSDAMQIDEKAMELAVICSGFMEENDVPVQGAEYRRKWVFNCTTPVLPRHVGFAIGPFEEVDLSEYRESEQDDKMGRSVVRVHGFCLPGRADELRNTCMPLASALDKLSTSFVFYPFESESSSYKVCFVDDLSVDVVDTATLSICSTRLLVPENVIDPLYDSTRELVHAVASQWLGVKISAKSVEDSWLIIGGSYFMADWFMMTLTGRNEHRFRLKLAADKVHELDINRPSLHSMGTVLEIDPQEYDFIKLKAPTVLSILHNRILKANGRIGVNRALSRVMLDDQVGKLQNSLLETDRFIRACEKVSHGRVDTFFAQWVYGSGCPTLRIQQRFNKKKLVVEVTILQVSRDEQVLPSLNAETFMREAKEMEETFPVGLHPVLFTGPMTIRIHEADGTPYEHIVDIKELTTKVEIPYNTKYKRLKRNRRAKERAAAAAGVDISGEPQDDALLYCLGDVLQSEEEIREWDLADWSKEDEDKMNNEHFEWIRLDKDFEWITKINFNQPHYMWVSQLQQDNDVVAQVESLQYLLRQQPFPLVSTILTRTLMDTRYFYGVRVMAVHALAKNAVHELDWIGLKHLEKAFHELYCYEDSNMTRSNDFSDTRNYKIQCAIPEAMAMVRDSNGKAPDRVKKFFLDTLKFNDNSNNGYSDSHYVATLISCLAQSLAVTGDQPRRLKSLTYEELESMTMEEQDNAVQAEREQVQQDVIDAENQRAALEIIQQVRRIDEWIPSYQNLTTVTALDSIRLLMGNGIIPKRLVDFLQYTSPGHSSSIRLKAFECLIELGVFVQSEVMDYFLVSFYEEPSPYFRSKLWKLIGRGLAQIALSVEEEPVVVETAQPTLHLEMEAMDIDKPKPPPRDIKTMAEAKANLRKRIGGRQELEDGLLDALRSPKISIDHFLDLLTVCRMLYDTVNRLIVKLRYPTYKTVKHIGDGKVRFRSTGRFRTT
ncbi:hypothetical protein BT63DRAFT_367208, partial [Microthyrium microscopicum]